MSSKTLYSLVALVVITALALPHSAGVGEAVAQTRGGKPGGSLLRTRKPSGGGVVRTPQKDSPSTPATTGGSKTGPFESPRGGAGEAGAGGANKKSTGLAGWIRDQWWLVVAVPVGAAVLGFSWFFLAGRRQQGQGGDLFPQPGYSRGSKDDRASGKGTGGFSSTRIRAEDVKTRLSGSVGGEEVETDQDYALVVEEEALSASAPSPEGSAQEVIESLLDSQDYEAAYEHYAQRIDEERSIRLDSGLEKKLGEKLIEAGQDEKAARVLEHHIATHPADDIEADAYFNLGYLHYRAGHIYKSKKYFGLFIEAEPDERRRGRASAILSALETR